MHAWLHLATPDEDSPLTWWLDAHAPEQGDLQQAATALAGQRLTLLLPAEAASAGVAAALRANTAASSNEISRLIFISQRPPFI